MRPASGAEPAGRRETRHIPTTPPAGEPPGLGRGALGRRHRKRMGNCPWIAARKAALGCGALRRFPFALGHRHPRRYRAQAEGEWGAVPGRSQSGAKRRTPERPGRGAVPAPTLSSRSPGRTAPAPCPAQTGIRRWSQGAGRIRGRRSACAGSCSAGCRGRWYSRY